MTVYIEVIFITNFFYNFFIFCFTDAILRKKYFRKSTFFSAGIGAIVSCIFPFAHQYSVLFKVLCLLILPFFAHKHRSIHEYLLYLITFSAVTILLGGVFFFITCFIGQKNIRYFSIGGIPILFSLSGMILIALIREWKKIAKKEIRRNDDRYKITLTDGKKEYTTFGFLDTGNRVYTKNDEPVTIVPQRVYTMFQGEEEEIPISTITGKDVIKAKKAEIKIYSPNYENRIYQTKIAFAPHKCGDEILLHSDMRGGIDEDVF